MNNKYAGKSLSKLIPLCAFALLALIISPLHLVFAQNTAASADANPFIITATGGGKLTDNDYSYTDGVLTIKSGTPMTVQNTDPEIPTTDCIVVDGSTLTGSESVELTLNGVNITVSEEAYDAPLSIVETLHLM